MSRPGAVKRKTKLRPSSSSKRRDLQSRALARPGDPFVLPDGKVIQADGTAKEQHEKANAYKVTPAAFKPQNRRALRDMPANGNPLKAIACVLVFSVMGMSDRDIASELGIDDEQVRRVRTHSAYEDCFNVVLGEFINANSNVLQSRIAAYQGGALHSIAEVAFAGTVEKNRLSASQDIMDRGETAAGIGKSAKQNTLRIIVEKADHADQEVSVELNGVAI